MISLITSLTLNEALKKVLEFGMVQGITEAMEQLDALLAEQAKTGLLERLF